MTDTQLERMLDTLASGSPAPVGEFVILVADGRWWWSDELYAIYGFAPGEVVPSGDLVASHRHPDHRGSTSGFRLADLADGGAFCRQQRILDARGRERTLLTVGHPVMSPDGDVQEVRGYVVDLTLANRAAALDEVDAAVAGVTVHRAAIEQAKGMLMVLLGLSGGDAFELMRGYSQQHNIKLKVLAEQLVDTLRRIEGPPTRGELDSLVARIGAAGHDGAPHHASHQGPVER